MTASAMYISNVFFTLEVFEYGIEYSYTPMSNAIAPLRAQLSPIDTSSSIELYFPDYVCNSQLHIP